MIYAYGNPGRKDDGLGCSFVNKLKEWIVKEKLVGFEFDCNYQLNIEDAHNISDKDLVIFVDASQENIIDFILTKVDESSKISFTSHEASPGYIYYLCKDLFNKNPATYLLHIKGYDWTFKEGLTAKAENNLNLALEFTKKQLLNKNDLIEKFHKSKLNKLLWILPQII